MGWIHGTKREVNAYKILAGKLDRDETTWKT
jgi:hypothetical protein